MGLRIRVLELYSGIGGMHWALLKSGIPHEVVMAVDINTTANQIYQHNFPKASLHSFGIEKLTVKQLRNLQVDAILMSPPCQPFTRVGNKGDCEDKRTKSFLHVLQLLREIDRKPCYILVENVKGFETSQTHSMLIETLQTCGYAFQEFLLTPLQFGIPNCRLRYYLTAKLKSKSFYFEPSSDILYSLPLQSSHHHIGIEDSSTSTDKKPSDLSSDSQNAYLPPIGKVPKLDCCDKKHDHNNSCSHRQVNIASLQPSNETVDSNNKELTCSDMNPSTTASNFHEPVSVHGRGNNSESDKSEIVAEDELEDLKNAGRNMRYCEEDDAFINAQSQPLLKFMEKGESDFSSFLLSDKDLRQFVVMDVVFPALKKSTCFTKRYGHYIEGAGSVVQMSTNVEDVRAASELKSWAVELKNKSKWGDQELSVLRKLQLRYFTPTEVANILCFPPEFDFPEGLNTVQKFRVLGNSLNVQVVAELLKMLTWGDFS